MEVLLMNCLGKPLWIWLLFIVLILGLIAFDLGLFHRKQKEVTISQSLGLSLFYILIGLMYGAWIWYYMGDSSASEYLTGYLVEKTLSLDNIFVISLIFSYFSVPQKYQHRVLFWGITGVIILRGIMIALGAALIEKFEWIAFIFAAFLIITGAKMLVMESKDPDLDTNPLLKWLRRHLRITPELHQEKFFVRLNTASDSKKQLWGTPLLLALIIIELADLIFAVDSIPAVFTITRDPYIVYTSNIFAILGLRALYFGLAAVISRFYYLRYSLALVLIFIGCKPFLAWWLNEGKFPAEISLAITLGLLGAGIVVSLFKTRPVKNSQQ